MILDRYINRQLFATTAVVTLVLTLVLVSGRFIRYMAEAASGKIAADALFGIMLFRLPEFLQMILPLSVYIALLLVFGRLYVDNEMVVIRSGGVGPLRLIRGLLAPIVCTMVVVGGFSLYATPLGTAEVARLVEAQKQRSALELLSPGRFHASSSGDSERTTYAESFDREAGELGGVFISSTRGRGERARMRIVRADTGRIVHRDNVRYLQLRHGRQYQGRPGQGDYQVATFDRALVRVSDDRGPVEADEIAATPTRDLVGQASPEARAELQWRISLVVLVPLMMLLAVPLARVGPRQGPFMRLVPALLIYMLYMAALLVVRSGMEDYKGSAMPWYLNMVWVHLVTALGVIGVYAWPRLSGRRVGG